ncbi:hypothetical protein VTN77DRAFT_6738 [Rasamsonia byssochlamydoides]|uniref:uncharacterized protein n=1 Tax=Rasamsonia byssochlamydoides TaxID=89139 RepID=UPI0037429130
MSTDIDGDSEMLSSSGSASPSGARTPTETRAHFTGSELSPPGSQTTLQHGGTGAAGFEKIGESQTPTDGKAQTTEQKEQPGASWMNQRAQEEYQRALESVVDKDFSLQEFGDPFDERDMTEQAF